MFDEDTIFKLGDKKTIYKIDNAPMRFLDKKQYISLLKKNNIYTFYSEELTKTYYNGKDQFTFIIIEAKKNNFDS